MQEKTLGEVLPHSDFADHMLLFVYLYLVACFYLVSVCLLYSKYIFRDLFLVVFRRPCDAGTAHNQVYAPLSYFLAILSIINSGTYRI